MIGGYRADEGDVDVLCRRRRQHVENGPLERQMIDFRANAKPSEKLHRRRQLRDHQVIDGPILSAGWLNSDLADQDRLADCLDAPHQGGVDMKRVLVEHEVGPEVLDLGEQDFFGLRIELRTKANLAGQWPEQRLEWRDGALHPCRKRCAGDLGDRLGRRGRHSVFARPCRLHPGIVDVDFRRLMAECREIPRIEIGDAEQAGISRRHLGRIGRALEPRIAAIEPCQKARVVRVEHKDAHDLSDRDPVAAIVVNVGSGGAALETSATVDDESVSIRRIARMAVIAAEEGSRVAMQRTLADKPRATVNENAVH